MAQSQWFGGTAEGWERAPYWLDGAIPLAWSLDDEALQARIRRYVTYIVEHQRADGWFGPYPEDAVAKRYDMWAILLVNKVLAQYHDATGDPRVLRCRDEEPARDAGRASIARRSTTGARFRWFEGLVADLPRLRAHARAVAAGPARASCARRAWTSRRSTRTDDITAPTPRRGLWKWTKHVVNTAMATKAAALNWRLDQRASDRAFAWRMIEMLDANHGQVTGMFTGDECLAGRNPLQGTELCAVVEFMYSLETLFSVFGDPRFADRLERVAFNALPATFSPDMWAHQYDQQVNQVQCSVNPEHGWTTNGPDSNLYGLEPNFGCCTANMHQGWPKFVAHLWMRTQRRRPRDDGLCAEPGRHAGAGRRRHGGDEHRLPVPRVVTVRISTTRAVTFPLQIRVPSWARRRDGARRGRAARRSGGARQVHRIEREWRGTQEVELRFPMRARITHAPQRRGRRRARAAGVLAEDRRSSGRGSTPTSRSASCRTAISRCGRRRRGTTD